MANYIKNIIFLLFFFLSVCMMGQEPSFRILSYNIRHGEGMDGRVDLERIARFVSQESPYVAAIQELDSCTERTARVDELGELAHLTGMYPVYAPSICFQGGKYGVGMLCREKPLSHYSIPIEDPSEPRVLLVVEFSNFVMACTHLPLHEQDRLNAIPVLCAEAEKAGKPFLLAGDWNDIPTSPFIEGMTEKFEFCSDTSVPTFPSGKPKGCIDYIAVYRSGSKDVCVTERTFYHHTPFSDHLPISVAIRLSGNASSR